MSNVVILPQTASERWDIRKAEEFLCCLEELLSLPNKPHTLNVELATGYQLQYQHPNAEPGDFWIVLRKRHGLFSRQVVSIHQGLFRSFMDVVKNDRRTNPESAYTLRDVSDMAERVRLASIHEFSGTVMNNRSNELTGNRRANGNTLNEQLRENWLVLTAVVGLALFFYDRTDHLEAEISQNTASKEYVDGKLNLLRTEMTGEFNLLNQRLDFMGVPRSPQKVTAQSAEAPQGEDNATN